MAFLDNISIYSNVRLLTQWANGKVGYIFPTKNETLCFYEPTEEELKSRDYNPDADDGTLTTLAYGFAYYWLRNRRKDSPYGRLMKGLSRSNDLTPKEIYDSYIANKKNNFYRWFNERTDSWKYDDPEALFYSQYLNYEYENELIYKSMVILDYIDEEDRIQFMDTMDNFILYLMKVVRTYSSQKKADEHENDTFNKYSDNVASIFVRDINSKEGKKDIDKVLKVAKECLNTSKAPEVALFLRVCTNLKILKNTAIIYINDTVKMLEELKIVTFGDDKKEFIKFRTNLGRKLERIQKCMNSKDEKLFDIITKAFVAEE